MLEQICRDERVDDVWFLNFFSTVTYSASKKVLQFIPLREMWEYGLVVKRYLEYSDISMGELGDVFEEIQYYLQQKDYIVHFVDEALESDRINLILNISLHDRKVTFRSWSLSGEMQESSLSYEEYGKRYMVCGLSGGVVRFDIYSPVKQKKEFHLSVLQKRMHGSKLSAINRKRCLADNKGISVSSKVMREWFTVFQDVISLFDKEQLFTSSFVIRNEERQLFETDTGYGDAEHLGAKIFYRIPLCVLHRRNYMPSGYEYARAQ